MIKQLGSDDFREREAAMESLQRIGRQALPALRIAQNSENLEVRHRAKMLLDQLDVGIQPLLNRGARIHYYSKQKPSPVSVDGVEMVGTAFSDDDLMHVREFTNIKRLSIPNASRITNAGLAHIRHLRSLESLTIGGAPINDLSALSGLKGLENLDLAGTKITDDGLASIKDHIYLLHLYLSKTSITDAGLVHLTNMKDLRSLDLSGTKLTDKGLAHLRVLEKMEILKLRDNQITDAGLVHLKELRKLRYLFLHGTKVTVKGVEELKKSLPDWYNYQSNLRTAKRD